MRRPFFWAWLFAATACAGHHTPALVHEPCASATGLTGLSGVYDERRDLTVWWTPWVQLNPGPESRISMQASFQCPGRVPCRPRTFRLGLIGMDPQYYRAPAWTPDKPRVISPERGITTQPKIPIWVDRRLVSDSVLFSGRGDSDSTRRGLLEIDGEAFSKIADAADSGAEVVMGVGFSNLALECREKRALQALSLVARSDDER